MNEEVEDHDFYLDFTTATVWEIFIARLEEVIHEWKLSQIKRSLSLKKNEFSDSKWEKREEKITFADTEFYLTRYSLNLAEAGGDSASPLDEDNEEDQSQILEDIMRLEHDFPGQTFPDSNSCLSSPHPIAVWYGIRDFLVLSPVKGMISSESKVKILLSSIQIAINNSNCPIPVFVQIHDPCEQYYLGVSESRGIRTEFEMVHLNRTPPHCKYLTGLLNVFKLKINSPITIDQVMVSVRFTYILRDWTSNTWTQEPPDFDFMQGEVEELGKLPFGASFDPISELHLFATWPRLLESTVVDSESYSDFDPSQANEWLVRIKMADQPACLLSEYLGEFLQLYSCKRTMHDLLGDLVNQNSNGNNLSMSLTALTDSGVPTISKVISKAKSQPRANKDGPISDDLLMPILYFLFPDAEDNSKNPYHNVSGEHSSGDNKQAEEQLSGLKTCPVDGLVWRLTIVMAHAIHTLGGIRSVAHLWYEFVQEMRFRWEKGITIPGIPTGFPDIRTCLLHQKLQMLNCCIDRKISREKMARAGSVDLDDFESAESEDDEFFDASNDPESSEDNQNRGSGNRRLNKHSLWNQPVGRLARHGNLKLLKTGEPLYIPMTQEPTPKTEDQVEEDVEVMVQLGTDAQAAELRARIMSASLLSDMESFKAANPGAVLEDFIRWYSPRDWIEEEGVDEYGQKKGTLSPRMQIKGNTWVEVWEAAKPVPARRQKRLFDDTREAEKVLHFLDSRKPAQVSELLLPVLLHASLHQLLQEAKEYIPTSYHPFIKRAERLTRNPRCEHKHYEDLATEIAGAEAAIAQANSLEHKFCGPNDNMTSESMHAFLWSLMSCSQVEIPGGPRGALGGKIRNMFAEAQKATQMLSEYEPVEVGEEPWANTMSSFPQPSKKEFIMRVSSPRPTPVSTVCPQKMYAALQRNDFRLAGCFSHDTTFQ